MGHQAQVSSILLELHRALDRLSTSINSPVPSHPSQSAPFLPPPHHYSTSAIVPAEKPVISVPPLNPIPRSTTTPTQRTFTDVIRDSILSQPVSHRNTRSANRHPLTTDPNQSRKKASAKLDHLRTLSKKGTLVCYKCGDTGHSTADCRNPFVCFACQKVGHKSFTCPSLRRATRQPPTGSTSQTTKTSSSSTSKPVSPKPSSNPPKPPSTLTMLPPPNLPLLTEANTLPVLRYYATPGTTKLRETLAQGLVIHDSSCLGPLFIQEQLHKSFPFPQWTWIARELPNNQYFIMPPDATWREERAREGKIVLGGITFQITRYIFHQYNHSTPLKAYWVQVHNIPHDLWRDTELRQLARDLGGVLLDSDPVTSSMIALRLKIGVPNKDVIPACRHLVFTDPSGAQSYYTIQTVVEDFGDFPRWGHSRLHVFNDNGKRTRSTSPRPRQQVNPPLQTGFNYDQGLFNQDTSLLLHTQPFHYLQQPPLNPPNQPCSNTASLNDILLPTPALNPLLLNLPSSSANPPPEPSSIPIPIPTLIPLAASHPEVAPNPPVDAPQPEVPPVAEAEANPDLNPAPEVDPEGPPAPAQPEIAPEAQAPPAPAQPAIVPEAQAPPAPAQPVPALQAVVNILAVPEAQAPPVPAQVVQVAAPAPALQAVVNELAAPEEPPVPIPVVQAAAVEQPVPEAQAPRSRPGTIAADEARHSLRLKVKEGASKSRGGKAGTSTGNVILNSFPYVHLTDLELIQLYEISGFNLGNSDFDKLETVHKLRSLSHSRFHNTFSDILGTSSKSTIPVPRSIDLNQLLLLPNTENQSVSNG